MNIENMLQNQTASLTMEHIYIDVLYIYIYILHIDLSMLGLLVFQAFKKQCVAKEIFHG